MLAHLVIGVRGIDFVQHLSHSSIHQAVERVAVTVLEARRIDKNELRFTRGQDAVNPVARSLSFFRSDADLRADHAIGQGRFADIGPSDDCDESGMKSHLVGICCKAA